MTHLLTKSEYKMYLKHPAWLWLKIHDKTKLPLDGNSTKAINQILTAIKEEAGR